MSLINTIKLDFFPHNFVFPLTGKFSSFTLLSLIYDDPWCIPSYLLFFIYHIFLLSLLFLTCPLTLILNLCVQLLCVVSLNILTGTLESVKSSTNRITVLFMNNTWKLGKFHSDHTFPYSVTVVHNLISSYFQLPFKWFLFFQKNQFL